MDYSVNSAKTSTFPMEKWNQIPTQHHTQKSVSGRAMAEMRITKINNLGNCYFGLLVGIFFK